jgi:hypothetical protein
VLAGGIRTTLKDLGANGFKIKILFNNIEKTLSRFKPPKKT